jgi:hypothetical protein
MGAISTGDNDIKERLSVAFLFAVAGRAGCHVTTLPLDRMSIDATVAPVQGANVKLDVQLKATSGVEFEGDQVLFDLPVRNYDHLRSTEVENAQILIVLDLPQEKARLMEVNEEALIMRRCAYWKDLYGMPPTTNTKSIRVHLPRAQLFTPEALIDLMERRLARLREGQGGLG